MMFLASLAFLQLCGARRMNNLGSEVSAHHPHHLKKKYIAHKLSKSKSNFTVCTHLDKGTPRSDEAEVPSEYRYAKALKQLDLAAVVKDMENIINGLTVDGTAVNPEASCWPADSKAGGYGAFMVRLAWHCSGNYRQSDGQGGCTGGRQRFEVERSWGDNANLDKARALLYPIKEKYGDGLSWGDLFILAGNTAYRMAGAGDEQTLKMCFGRIDEPNGDNSEILETEDPNGEFGGTGPAMIYVDAQGELDANGKPDIMGVATEVRSTFQKMGHSDRAAVALIGGGHAVGKVHGACSLEGAGGLSPRDAYAAGEVPWQGICQVEGNSDPKGMGANAFTSGFEGYWSKDPSRFDNDFFTDMIDPAIEWEFFVGPGGLTQWRIKGATDPVQTMLMRLTSDLALTEDASYKAIVEEYAGDMDAFTKEFRDAWFLLITRGSGKWSSAVRCDGDGVVPESLNMRDDDEPKSSKGR